MTEPPTPPKQRTPESWSAFVVRNKDGHILVPPGRLDTALAAVHALRWRQARADGVESYRGLSVDFINFGRPPVRNYDPNKPDMFDDLAADLRDAEKFLDTYPNYYASIANLR